MHLCVTMYCLFQRRQSGLKSGGSWFRVKKSIFQGKFPNSFDFSGKNWPFTATSGQIILFLFKSHHFQTYFLYIIRYNNISRPLQPPSTHTTSTTPLPKVCGSRPPELTPLVYLARI